jgi:tripartite-type tricarboxylate transporter receptor subunit TctC
MTKKPGITLCRRAVVLGVASSLLKAGSARGDEYPSRPIRLIVPFGPGSIADIVAREVGKKAGESLKRPFVIENRPGAGGIIGAQEVANARPDGYTICLGTVASHSITGAMQKLPYDVAKDFKPVALLVATSTLIAVHKDVPVKTLPEYLDWARKRGGSNYVSGGFGTTTQLLPELIRVRLNVPLQHIAAARVGDSLNDFIAGRVDMISYPALGLKPYLDSGVARPLAVASTSRLKAFPDLPTVNEALNSTGYDLVAWWGVFAPAKTPAPIVRVLSDALCAAVVDLSDEFEKIGVEARGWDSDKFDAFFRSEVPRWAEIVGVTGVKPN